MSDNVSLGLLTLGGGVAAGTKAVIDFGAASRDRALATEAAASETGTASKISPAHVDERLLEAQRGGRNVQALREAFDAAIQSSQETPQQLRASARELTFAGRRATAVAGLLALGGAALLIAD